MTANQIAFHKLQEEIRHNKTSEDELNRSNVAKEAENFRSNSTKERETERHNREAEEDADKDRTQRYINTAVGAATDVGTSFIPSTSKSLRVSWTGKI